METKNLENLLKFLVCDADINRGGSLNETMLLNYLIGFAHSNKEQDPRELINLGEQLKNKWLEESEPLRKLYYQCEQEN